MDTLIHDLRYALRQLVRSPGVTIVATLTLALGIGINTAMFSLVNAVLYRPIPVEDPERLVRIYTSEWEQSGVPTRFYGTSSYPDLIDLQAALGDQFTGLAAWERARVGLARGNDVTMLGAAFVAGDFFGVYGAPVSRGRAMRADEISEGAAVALITEHVWRSRLDEDPDVLGRTVVLAGEPFTVIGIVPEASLAPMHDDGVDVVLPLAAYGRIFADAGLLSQRDSRWLDVVGRLRPVVSVAQAQATLTTTGERIGVEHPAESGNRRYTVRSAATLVGFAGGSAADIKAMMAATLIVAGLVLLIACANVANLMLARASRRGREIAIRLSLGAGRRRIVRQLLTESMVLAAFGGVAAVLLGLWAADALRLLPLPAGIVPAVDARVLAYTSAVALGAGILFGLAPALHGTRDALAHTIRVSGGPTVAAGTSRLRSGLLVSQIALSFVLLVAGGLLGRTIGNMRDADPGFDTRGLVVASVSVDRRRASDEEARATYQRIGERLAALPGVRGVALASAVPFVAGARTSIEVPGYEPAEGERMEIHVNSISRGYFEIMGWPLVRGSTLDALADGAPAVVINEAMARRYWTGRDPVGATLRVAGGPPVTVVGVARDARFGSLTDAPMPMFFRPIPPVLRGSLALHLRTSGEPAVIATAAQRAIRDLDPSLTIASVRPLSDVLAESTQPTRVAAAAMSASGALALLLACVGLFGVMAFVVSMRTREIGIRMALGAHGSTVLCLILGDGMRLAAVGIGVGALLALGVTHVLSSALYGVTPRDPLTFAAIAALLSLVAVAASWIPARRAARVDPLVALRAE
ncbi:MAG TPA: ABC transporter permease [Gemmatimonadaceae bacterium]|nr:ABC transporter permease [Gemmatimonadaceae bacterium]